jgi:hypothetical protein
MKAIIRIDESATLSAAHCDPASRRLASVLLGQLRSAGISEIHCEIKPDLPAIVAQPVTVEPLTMAKLLRVESGPLGDGPIAPPDAPKPKGKSRKDA